MALWTQLTTEQQDTYLTYLNQLRAAEGQLHQVLNTFVELDTFWDASIGAISTALDNSEKPPNTSGLAGAVEVTDTEVVAAKNDVDAILATYNTAAKKQARNKLAGINATL